MLAVGCLVGLVLLGAVALALALGNSQVKGAAPIVLGVAFALGRNELAAVSRDFEGPFGRGGDWWFEFMRVWWVICGLGFVIGGLTLLIPN
jgi:hypothetical protein